MDIQNKQKANSNVSFKRLVLYITLLTRLSNKEYKKYS